MESKERYLQALIVEFCRYYEISEEYVQEIFEESRDKSRDDFRAYLKEIGRAACRERV